ncbi:DUF1345 domain-containing protein [Methylocystis bryophila]|uniref:DUF1345 domain-containing protein n=1 Tax=Methylocystis bryophila TaxID=655015 RepID=A0A1W6MRK4_9HYPH|nr:DUF1345 domain-containing protein [Methylocystis bryophila]ARN80240.1 hypothetical protein B1812_03105 [Methylocystis bryophila]BDV40197.1 membrane protein [Methylocystis bryophila]
MEEPANDDEEFKPRRPRRSVLLRPFRVVRGRPRLFICAVLGVVIGVFLPAHMRLATRALIAWNITVLCYLVGSARLITKADSLTVRERAKIIDEGRVTILVLAIGVACASMGAIVLELGPVKQMEGWSKALHLGLTVLTVLDSWTFMHLTFAFHYAHEYYDEYVDDPANVGKDRGGLNFPGGEAPNYADFLYYAFVIGLASQTADVATTSRPMRLLTVLHGTLAFFYNLAIIGLTVNIASGLV